MIRLLPWRTLGLAAALLGVAAFPGAFSAGALERTAVADGELWRLLSAHFVHLSGYHLGWNVGPLILLGMLFEPVLRGRLWLVLAASAMSVSVGTLVFAPDLAAYCGLSGVLNGVFVGGALMTLRRDLASGNRAGAGLILLATMLALAKILVEGGLGVVIFTDAAALGGQPMPLAHALGALGGLVVLWPTTHRPQHFRDKGGYVVPVPVGCETD